MKKFTAHFFFVFIGMILFSMNGFAQSSTITLDDSKTKSSDRVEVVHTSTTATSTAANNPNRHQKVTQTTPTITEARKTKQELQKDLREAQQKLSHNPNSTELIQYIEKLKTRINQ